MLGMPPVTRHGCCDPRPLAEGDAPLAVTNDKLDTLRSTPPSRRATGPQFHNLGFGRVAIHAPLAEGDQFVPQTSVLPK